MAGSWTKVTDRGASNVSGGVHPNMAALTAVFTADAADASIPDLSLTAYPISFVTDVAVKFDGTTPPDSCTVSIKDLDGLVIHPNDSLIYDTSGRYTISDRPSCVGGVTVSVEGNTTNSAKATVVVYCVLNKR